MTPRSATVDIKFTSSGFVLAFPAERERIVAFSAGHAGKEGYMEIAVGSRTRSYRQNRFFHGPLINAFIRLTGTADPDYWKWELKSKFLKRFTPDGKQYVAETSSLSVAEFSAFIDSCVQLLIDQGGHLEEAEGREWQETKPREEWPS